MKSMDDIVRQQMELDKAFEGIKKGFDAAYEKFRQRSEAMLTQIHQQQKIEEQNLLQITPIIENMLQPK